jgi:hypothetical protein
MLSHARKFHRSLKKMIKEEALAMKQRNKINSCIEIRFQINGNFFYILLAQLCSKQTKLLCTKQKIFKSRWHAYKT